MKSGIIIYQMQNLSPRLNIVGKYQSYGHPIVAMETDKNRSRILSGHKEFITLLQVHRASDQNMFEHKFTFQTDNLKQLSWNKLMEEKIAVASERRLIIYDMEKPVSDQDFAEYYNLNNSQRVGDIQHIQWMNNHANVMLVAEGSQFRIWDLRAGANNGAKLEFFNELSFDQIHSRFKVNSNDTLIGSFSYDGYVKIFDLRKLGHSEFSNPLYNVSVPFVSVFEFDPKNPNVFLSCGNQILNIFELVGDRADSKVTIHSVIDAQHLVRSISNPDLIYSFGERKMKIMQQDGVQAEVHGFNIKHKGRAERFYNLGQEMNKVLTVTLAEKTSLIITHEKQRLMGFSTEPYMSFYNTAPHNPVLLDQQWHHVIYNLEQASHIKKRHNKKFSKPIIYINQPSIANNQGMSFQQQIKHLHEQYKIMGNLDDISFQNARIAQKFNKPLCEDMWNNLPLLLSMQNDCNAEDNKQTNTPSMLETLLQQAVDQGELPTVVYYSIVVHDHNPNILRKSFITNIFAAYLQILRRFNLYYIAARICIDSKTEEVTRNTQKNITAKIRCVRCNKKIPQKESKCKTAGCAEAICFCKEPLRALILWCQGCQHGFHVDEAIEWFSQTDQCPYACGHKCYKIMQKDFNKIIELKRRAKQSDQISY